MKKTRKIDVIKAQTIKGVSLSYKSIFLLSFVFLSLLLFPLVSSALSTCNITGSTCTSCDQVFYNFTGSFTEDYFYGGTFMSNYPTCLDTTNYYRLTLADGDCDPYITNSNNADCAGYDDTQYFAVCPSYERKGSAVNTSDCYTDGYMGPVGNISEAFNFSDAYFSGPLAPTSSGYFTFVIEVNSTAKDFRFNSDNTNMSINWGDGVIENVTGTRMNNHTYSTAGFYNISLKGYATRIYFGGLVGNTPEKLRDVLTPMSDGLTGITSGGNMFFGATNITTFTSQNFFDDVSPNVTSLVSMFYGATNFNMDLNNWNTSQVTSLLLAFSGASSFNGNISNWDTHNVTTMNSLFQNALKFNQSINSWNTSKVTDMAYIFNNAPAFNQPLNDWDVSKVTTFYAALRASSFNQPLDKWNTSSARTMQSMFSGATNFNQSLNSWDTSKVTNMGSMFQSATNFNGNISNWNTSSVTNMNSVFSSAKNFNQDISNWDTSKVTNMGYIFSSATAFNQPLNNWNTSSLTNMQGTFYLATNFNQPLNNWDVSKVTIFQYTFQQATSFNQDLNNWNTSNVTRMDSMFQSATSFNQDLGSWNVSKVTGLNQFVGSITLSPVNYDSLLNGWLAHGVKNNVVFSGGNSKYTILGNLSRYTLINTHNWTITDGGITNDTNKPNLTLYNYTGSFRNKVESQQLATDDYGISYWWINNTTHFQIDQTGLITNKTAMNFGDLFWINVSVNDTFNNIASGIVYVNITSEPQEYINIISPVNQTYDVGNILLSISSPDAVNITYNYNGTNFTYTSPEYLTFVDGNYTLEAYAYFSNGHFNQTQVSFEVAIVPVIPSEMTIAYNNCNIPNNNPACRPQEKSYFSGTFNCSTTPNITIVNGLITNVEC